jgi:YegS/Rv2252/BmrU family lipid kinase
MPRRALLVANLQSRRAPELIRAAVERLRSHPGLRLNVVDVRDASSISRLIVELRETCDLVIVGGGDGTMNAAARGLLETKLPLGILPLGTANDLARTLGIPEDLDAAARLIAEGEPRLIDVGEVNGHPFFNVASIGLSAELAQGLTGDLKKRFGRLGYAIAAMRVLARAKPFRAVIESELGTAKVLTLQVAVGNGRFYGGGMAIEKNAAIDDGHLDLYSLEMRRAWKLAFMARAFRYGEHGAWREVRAAQASEFEVRTRKEKPVNADGEIVTTTPARFRVHPKALAVYAPASGPGLNLEAGS